MSKPSKSEIKQSLNFYNVLSDKMTVDEYKALMPKKRGKPQYKESEEQIAFVKWCVMRGYPYNLIFAIENEGIKTPQAGARAKRMGKRAGVCDLFLPYMSGTYGGLFIEMKSAIGRLSENQKKFIEIATKEGYKCNVCHSSDEAVNAIKSYVGGESSVLC